MRHGETQWNVENRCQGQTDSPLTERGLAQARELADQFRGKHFDAVFSSDLLRAKRTAEIITTEHDLVVLTHKALRERNFGRIEGMTWIEAEELLGEKLFRYRDMVGEERFTHLLEEGMETDEQIVSRFLTYLREIAVGYGGKQVLVVCHGGLMRTVLIHLGFGSHAELSHGAVQNLGYFVLQSDGVELEIVESIGIDKKKSEIIGGEA